MSDDRIRNPAIAEVEIKQPMFILGLPRCGTSLLHALIDGDPQIRTPLMWEVADPSPPPEAETFETRSEEHSSELQSLMRISYAVFCLKKKKHNKQTQQMQLYEDKIYTHSKQKK